MFIDTSVIVALLTQAPEAVRYAARIGDARLRYTSALVLLDATARLSAILSVHPLDVDTAIQALLDEADITVVAISGAIGRKAVEAMAAYGDGGGHPARLSLCECLSYACAQAYRVPLLFTGERFAHTDVRVA